MEVDISNNNWDSDSQMQGGCYLAPKGVISTFQNVQT